MCLLTSRPPRRAHKVRQFHNNDTWHHTSRKVGSRGACSSPMFDNGVITNPEEITRPTISRITCAAPPAQLSRARRRALPTCSSMKYQTDRTRDLNLSDLIPLQLQKANRFHCDYVYMGNPQGPIVSSLPCDRFDLIVIGFLFEINTPISYAFSTRIMSPEHLD